MGSLQTSDSKSWLIMLLGWITNPWEQGHLLQMAAKAGFSVQVMSARIMAASSFWSVHKLPPKKKPPG